MKIFLIALLIYAPLIAFSIIQLHLIEYIFIILAAIWGAWMIFVVLTTIYLAIRGREVHCEKCKLCFYEKSMHKCPRCGATYAWVNVGYPDRDSDDVFVPHFH
jgi:hypothetical protein